MNKKLNFKISVISNLLILVMLVLVNALTLNFESQYVFSVSTDQAIYYGNKDSNYVTLMINVYWGNEYLPQILKTLNDYDVKTTFFVGGSWAEKYPELLQQIYNNGHEIANHGYFHKDHKTLNYDQNITEIKSAHSVVNTLIGVQMNLFAPPSGAYNKTTLKAANDAGYKTIMWSKDTIDWRDKDTNIIYTRATNNVVGGDLILMHPTQHTAEALPNILEFYKTNNLSVVPVSVNIA